MNFTDLPCDIKKIIFKYNKIDSTSKCKKELYNFSNKLKFNNVLRELIDCFNEYIFINQWESLNLANESKINVCDIVGGKIIYPYSKVYISSKISKIFWLKKNDNSGIINGKITRLYCNMYLDVKTKMKILVQLLVDLSVVL
jgi:hypothetical protein